MESRLRLSAGSVGLTAGGLLTLTQVGEAHRDDAAPDDAAADVGVTGDEAAAGTGTASRSCDPPAAANCCIVSGADRQSVESLVVTLLLRWDGEAAVGEEPSTAGSSVSMCVKLLERP